MRSVKVWLFSGVLAAILLGTGAFLATSPSQAQQAGTVEQPRADQSYWRYHDNRWSHWDARDQRWYYTNGQHWFYHENNRWMPYRFDRNFGREGFVRGSYQVPAANTNIVAPTHEVYAPR